ncbi:MAG: penicillin-binding transpeptidase domain-containing protein, partial [Candidatus Parcubacteria bacterium]|nr:penicillin-binding transpeptidase domain-containing protein [Candidatus Parcubacteria bacterium]
MALNQTFYLIYAQTYAVTDAEDTAKKMNTILDLSPEVMAKITEQLKRPNDPYEPLVHRVTEEKIKRLAALNLAGIKWDKESLRYYPEGVIGSNIVGFVGWVGDNLVGQYGIEGYFNKELTGEAGFQRSEHDAQGRLIGVANQDYKKPVNGSSYILTIDNSLEAVVCQKLDEGAKKYGADGGTIIVMNPKTGAILALCGNPDYDPNAYGEASDLRAFTNSAIFDAYE